MCMRLLSCTKATAERLIIIVIQASMVREDTRKELRDKHSRKKRRHREASKTGREAGRACMRASIQANCDEDGVPEASDVM